ncbi:histidine phosphatase family protein [Paenibacillus cymbidii]|uniref:histidine phosphatase family protein n=1 Tax=Paenibacillus cymbidii TaxID=1639034 RepID=UPI001F2C391D|nr:histidine phosphatase family protein [Paenibacillus cymbidii]
MELLVVRHGQSVADIEGRFEGRADFALTDRGVEQSKRVADWINDHYKPDAILSSPLKRAKTTAETIGARCGVEVSIRDEIMEWNNGLLAGLKREEGIKKFPLPPGGRKPHDTFAETESLIQFRARAETFLSQLLDEHGRESGKRICLVSHGGFINMLFRSFLRLPLETEISITSGDTAVHLWQANGRDRRILFNNYQAHL